MCLCVQKTAVPNLWSANSLTWCVVGRKLAFGCEHSLWCGFPTCPVTVPGTLQAHRGQNSQQLALKVEGGQHGSKPGLFSKIQSVCLNVSSTLQMKSGQDYKVRKAGIVMRVLSTHWCKFSIVVLNSAKPTKGHRWHKLKGAYCGVKNDQQHFSFPTWTGWRTKHPGRWMSPLLELGT